MEERIRLLFRKYLTNTCTKEEFEEVFRHLENTGNDPVMREELRKIYEQELGQAPSEVFVGADGIMAGLDADGVAAGSEHSVPEHPIRRRRTRRVAAIALTAVVLTAGIWWLAQKRTLTGGDGLSGSSSSLAKLETRRSESKHLVLPDSSQVWLNAASTIEFPGAFNKERREVLLSGEAFFDVQHAEQSPFIIHTGKISIVVLGTAFNIKAYPGQEKVSITVKKGKVKVNVEDRPVALLTMGQQVIISNRDSVIRQKTFGPETRSWQEGILNYDDYTIGDILADLERVYNVKIRLDNPAAAGVRVSTAFKRADGIQKALEVIGELSDTEPLMENGVYILK